MSRRGKLAEPISPGQVLRDNIGVTQDDLAKALNVSRFTVNQLMNGKRGVTAAMALRLARVTSTSAEYWLNLQRDVDLYEATQRYGAEIEKLKVLRAPKPANELFVSEE